jgi:hypothetical protein
VEELALFKMQYLDCPTVFWLGEGTISLSDVRQTDIHTASPLVPVMPIENLKKQIARY